MIAVRNLIYQNLPQERNKVYIMSTLPSGIHPYISNKEALLLLSLLEQEIRCTNTSKEPRYHAMLVSLATKIGNEFIRSKAAAVMKELQS